MREVNASSSSTIVRAACSRRSSGFGRPRGGRAALLALRHRGRRYCRRGENAQVLSRRLVRVGQADSDGLAEPMGVSAEGLGELHDERILGVVHDREVKTPIGVEVAAVAGDPLATLKSVRRLRVDFGDHPAMQFVRRTEYGNQGIPADQGLVESAEFHDRPGIDELAHLLGLKNSSDSRIAVRVIRPVCSRLTRASRIGVCET